MVRLPWRSDDTEDVDAESDALVECSFQDGSLFVYDDRVRIARPGRSRFDDKTVDMGRITGVRYEKGLTIGYLQIEEAGVEADSPGLLSDPIDENTVHFGRGRPRVCPQRTGRDLRADGVRPTRSGCGCKS